MRQKRRALGTAALILFVAAAATIPLSFSKYAAAGEGGGAARVAAWAPEIIGTLDDGYIGMTPSQQSTYRSNTMQRIFMKRNVDKDFWLPDAWFKGVSNEDGEVSVRFELWAQDNALPSPYNTGYDDDRYVENFYYSGLKKKIDAGAVNKDLTPGEVWNWTNSIPAANVPASHPAACTHLSHIIRWRSVQNGNTDATTWAEYNTDGRPNNYNYSTTALSGAKVLDARTLGASYYRDITIHWTFVQID